MGSFQILKTDILLTIKLNSNNSVPTPMHTHKVQFNSVLANNAIWLHFTLSIITLAYSRPT